VTASSGASHLNELALPAGPDAADAAKKAAHARSVGHDRGFHGWSRRVSDVMATSVVTVDRATLGQSQPPARAQAEPSGQAG
jgi:hypothetical protein